MKKHIICLGDSNTHGYCADPKDCTDGLLFRFNEQERWPCLLQQALGEEYLVAEEGLSGRTTVFEDPLYEGLSALQYLYPCLKSHEPVSLLIVMLGTNDAKERFSANAYAIALGMRRLVRKAQSIDCWGPGGKPNILIVAPPPIGAGLAESSLRDEMGLECVEKSRQIPHKLRVVAGECGCHYLSAEQMGCAFNNVDFMHLTRQSHAVLAQALADAIPAMIR